MKVLITGAAGYKGTHLVDQLLAQGYEVFALDNFMYQQKVFQRHLQNKKFHLKKADVREVAAYKDWLNSCDVFIPLACLTGAPICQGQPVLAREINHGAVVAAMDVLAKSQAVLFPMTNSGYGIGEANSFCDEQSPLRPLSNYGRLKVETEQVVLQRENAISFRFATLFGMSDRMRYDLLVNDFMWKAQSTGVIRLFEGHFRRNYLHVMDGASVYKHAIENFDTMKSNIFNVGLTEANMTKKELCLEIQKLLPQLQIIEDESQQDPDKRDYVVSNKKIEATGFKCQSSLQAGLLELQKGYVLGRSEFEENSHLK